ncbi:hypothetical protein FRC02_008586 [Tulasnella sp. 418]|nr:hypothetical protein FRC02_008586 [Tulasnella sp. 418]
MAYIVLVISIDIYAIQDSTAAENFVASMGTRAARNCVSSLSNITRGKATLARRRLTIAER